MAELRSNRRFLERVVSYLAGECGIRQFIDNGSGLPIQQNVHQVAQGIDPGVRAVYIDNDPVVLRHQKVSALLAAGKSTAYLMEDARDVDRILSHHETKRLIDFEFFVQRTGGHFGRLRERAEVDTFFEGVEIVEPGLVRVAGWRAGIPAELRELKAFEYGGVGRKPACH